MNMQGPSADQDLPRLLVLASTYPRWANDPEPGFVHELSKRLTSRFRVTVLCPHAAGAVREEILDGVKVIRYRYAPPALERLVNDGGIITNLRRSPWMALLVPSFMFGQLCTLLRLMYKQPPDVIHAHWIVPQGLNVAIAMMLSHHRRRFVVTSHGADLFALRGRLMSRLKNFVLRRASGITVVSRAMREEIVNLGMAVNHVVIAPMGTELTHRFSPDKAVTRRTNELLFVGRMVEKKGLKDLIQALPMVIEHYPDTILKVVGFGPEEVACRALARELELSDKVHFLGALPQSHLPALYRRATALVAPFVIADSGDQEGLGLVMVEAVGCLCPVITTRIPAIQEVFGGQWPPYIAAPQSPQSLAEQINRLMGEPELASQWITSLRADIAPRFDYPAIAALYAEILYANTHKEHIGRAAE